MHFSILLLSLTVASAVNLNCNQQNYVCDGEEVVCNCTAPCSEPIHWWDNNTISFCSRTQLCNGNRQNCEPDTSPPVRVEVINCSSSDTFTSRLSYNASLEVGSTSTTIQIGCSTAVNGCSPEGEPSETESVSLLVINCTGRTVPDPPRNLRLSMMESAQCNNPRRIISITWEAPKHEPSARLPVTGYNLTCTSGGGDSCSETLPADTKSYDLTVVAGVQHTITVSALSNGRESQGNPHCNFAIVEVLNVTMGDSSATIQLQNDNFTSNFTITYGLCSEDSRTTKSLNPPVVHLENLTANTTYCYSITYDGNDLVATVCSGTFTTATETTPTTQPTTSDGPNIPVAVGVSVGVFLLIVITVAVVCLVCIKQGWWRRRHEDSGAGQ